jgi:hypothetical protein
MSMRVCAVDKCSIEAILGSRDVINIHSLTWTRTINIVNCMLAKGANKKVEKIYSEIKYIR